MSLLIDTDPTLGIPFKDVDDALAIWLLLRAAARGEGPKVVGLCSVFGNGTGAQTDTTARELGARWHLPVHRGAADPTDVDNPAVTTLIQHTGDVLAIGPQTNIAAALARGARWSRLIVLGGTDRKLPNVRPLHTTELNFALDEAAANAALACCTTLVPMEVCRKVLFRKADFDVLPRWMEESCRSWLRLGPLLTGHRGVVPWDIVAAMYLVRPELFTVERRSVRMAPSFGKSGYIGFGEGQTEVLVDLDVDAFRRAWLDLAGS